MAAGGKKKFRKRRLKKARNRGTKRTANARARTRAPRKASSPPDWGPLWLEAFAESRKVSEACRVTGKGRTTVYDRRADDEDFAEAWNEIILSRKDDLRDGMWNRAIKGDRRPIVVHEIMADGQRQTRVLQHTTYDTGLQKFLATTQMREEFGPGAAVDDERERAFVACELLKAMRDSVPEFEE